MGPKRKKRGHKKPSFSNSFFLKKNSRKFSETLTIYAVFGVGVKKNSGYGGVHDGGLLWVGVGIGPGGGGGGFCPGVGRVSVCNFTVRRSAKFGVC